MFAVFLWSTVVLIFAYSCAYGYYLYYALLIDPCKDDLTLCPDLRWVALIVLILQSIIYINYLICCIFLLISMKRIHSVIQQNYSRWSASGSAITNHVIAFTLPIIIHILVVSFADPYKVLQVNNEAVTGNERVLIIKRDTQATFYFLLEISQAVIGSVLIYIVVSYSRKQKQTMIKRQDSRREVAHE